MDEVLASTRERGVLAGFPSKSVRFGHETGAPLRAAEVDLDRAPIAAVTVRTQARPLEDLLDQVLERHAGAVGDPGQQAGRGQPR